jgi:hypothetical protein
MWPFTRHSERHSEPSTIRVRFIDAADETVLDDVDVPVERLPDSFEHEPTMHVRDDDWIVASADPPTAAAYRKSRKLTLRLRRARLQMLDPSEVLFSLPTIHQDMPRLISAPADSQLLRLHEDDWRQLEWVSARELRDIEAELLDIRAIYEIDQVGVGFRRTHERGRVPRPLRAASIEFRTLQMTLGPKARWCDGVALHRYPGMVENSFAARTPGGIELYGTTTDDNFLDCLAFSPEISPDAVTGSDVQTLLSFATLHDLLLVDWVRGRLLRPEEPPYRALFHADA